MAYHLRISASAQRQVDEFSGYLREYSERFAVEQMDRLNLALSVNLAESPNTWSYFTHMGAPYRAYLFRVGRRTQYWIIYTVDDENRTVDILHFWNASRDPASLTLP
jgi:mRNA-degrading endonuclease RelE of RelBE toxin-antitoxin system